MLYNDLHARPAPNIDLVGVAVTAVRRLVLLLADFFPLDNC